MTTGERPKIALTMGCPQGIGPEIAVSATAKLQTRFDITIYGDSDVLVQAAELKKVQHPKKVKQPDDDTPDISFNSVKSAVKDVLAGKFDALVTCPINKHRWGNAKIPFTGHTEALANLSESKNYAMMMASPSLKVTLATIHAPLRDIPKLLTQEKIIIVTKLTHNTLKQYFHIQNPRIAVAALNPHSGDNGLLGDEEDKIIKPAVRHLTGQNIDAKGPFPGDSIFHKTALGEFDAAIAMYHDQGLSAIKTLDYKRAVNITLGLPFIRTSVGHGTAEDIAWKGIADDSNLIAAIETAEKMLF